jgi:hypothetical protein
MRNALSLVAIILFLVCAGCAQHGFGFRNITDKAIKDVELTYDRQGNTEKRIAINYLHAPGGFWRMSPGVDIPREGEAKWTTPDGVLHRQHVDILGALSHFTTVPGYVYLDFGFNDVAVSFSPGRPD